MVRIAHVVVLLSVFACSGSSTIEEPAATDEAPPTDQAEVPATAPHEVQPGYFTAAWALWRAPSDEKRIPNPDGEGEVKNYLTNVERARGLQQIAVKEDWSKVKSDEDEGWIKTERIVVGEQVKLATVLDETRIFQKPDAITLIVETKIQPGTVLIVADNDGRFSEVDHPTGKYDSERTWVQTENLVFDETEIEAAKFVRRIMQLREDGKEDAAAEFEDLARGQFAGSKLLALLDRPEPEEVEGGGEGGEPRPTEVRPNKAP